MSTPFRLADHRRGPQPPLAPPPDRYFEQLPRRVMQRVPTAAPPAAAWNWLTVLPLPLRTALASAVVLGGFAASFWLSTAPTAPAGAGPALARVPREEMLQYLLASETRLTLTDLAELPAATTALPAESYLHASPEEVQAALDAQPAEDSYL